ncbi:MAG: hypothetical protein KBC21_00530 [Candidatus Pacebacteria bacterium]|nr:hypothetical protein [Candidatus Paceibacterota bacterium]
MKKVLTATLLGFALCAHAQQQQIPMAPPFLVQEVQVGDVVCVMSRQFGQLPVLTINLHGSALPAKLIDDISKCAAQVQKSFKEFDSKSQPQNQKKT